MQVKSILSIFHMWIVKTSLKTQELTNFEISFENFQKMLDGPKFGKRCLWGILIQNFIRFGKF
jgi:hypothetical protein